MGQDITAMWSLTAGALVVTLCIFFRATQGVELPDVHEAALVKALNKAASPKNTVLVTIMDGNMANMMFPPFFRSLQASGEAENLLVICQDSSAYSQCVTQHEVDLCLESVADGAPLFRDESSKYHHESCWRKPWAALAIIELGFNVVILDVDIIAFKPILPAIDWSQDLMAASDCNRDEHNLTVRGIGSPDSGVIFAKASPATSKFFHRWLASRGKPGIISDQWGLWGTLNDTSPSDLAYRTWGPPHVMASFCCHYCNALIKSLGTRRKEWTTVCPPNVRKDWVLFQAACIAWALEDLPSQKAFDTNLMKKDALLALWHLQKGSDL